MEPLVEIIQLKEHRDSAIARHERRVRRLRALSVPARHGRNCRRSARHSFGRLTERAGPGRHAGGQSVQVWIGWRIGFAQRHGLPRRTTSAGGMVQWTKIPR
jgi:hypothetical protein